MSELFRQTLVFDLTNDKVLASYDFDGDARKFAMDHAERNIGVTVVVFEVKEAYRAEACVSKVYLDYAPRENDVKQEAPPTSPSDFDTSELV